MSRCILILNRGSGGNERESGAPRAGPLVESAFRDAGHEIETRSAEPQHIGDTIRRAVSENPDVIVIGGGDGTVSTAAQMLGGTGIALGVLPLGTFNLAARDLGVPLDLEEAATFLASAETRAIDVLDVSGHACLCTTILGFYPEYSAIFERRDHGGQWWKKAFKLFTGVPRVISRARSHALAWNGGGNTGHVRTKFAAFVPGRYRESAGLVPARTDFQSGKLTAYIGTQKSAATVLRGIMDYTLGRQEQNPDLIVFDSPALELHISRRKHTTVMLDGEILRLPLPLKLEILPRHLHVLTSGS